MLSVSCKIKRWNRGNRADHWGEERPNAVGTNRETKYSKIVKLRMNRPYGQVCYSKLKVLQREGLF